MNLVGIGNNIINLDQVTRILIEEGGVTFFFANLIPVNAFGGSQQPDKLDQLKLLGVEAEMIRKFLSNEKNVAILVETPQAAKAVKLTEKWETNNNFPSE